MKAPLKIVEEDNMLAIDEVKWQLDSFDLGAATAEKDPLLEVAKIETQEFYDLYWHDRIDIIRGIKGAGKTALYRLFWFLQQNMIEKKGVHCIFGIEATGDPVFKQYQAEFQNFNEIEFENFWGLYFIVLVYQTIRVDEALKWRIGSEEIRLMDEKLKQMGIVITCGPKAEIKDISRSIIDRISQCKTKVGIETKLNPSGQVVGVQPTLELDLIATQAISKKPIYLADFRDLVISILEKKGLKIWIMLDRLDEVFPHRSDVEKNGLRGILKAAYNFSHPALRIKIFLRDDIIDYLATGGFTALTHVVDRSSSTMTWSKDNILYLIVRRLSSINHFVQFYNIDIGKVENDKNYREDVFYFFFPRKIGKTSTIDWLCGVCADANNVITPRDIIEFFRFAKALQFRKFQINPLAQECLITAEVFPAALEDLSKHKKTTFLFAEFPHLKEIFLKFEGGYTEYKAECLMEILGEKWKITVDELRSIGFVKFDPKKAVYKIPTIWQKGLTMKRGKSFRKSS